MVMTAVLFLVAPDLLGRAFTNDAGVVRVAALLLPIAGVFQIFDGLQAVAAGALRGAGDTRGPLIANLLGFWSFGLPLSVVLTFRLDQGPAGLWWGLAAGLAAVAVLLLLRVRVRLAGEPGRLMVE